LATTVQVPTLLALYVIADWKISTIIPIPKMEKPEKASRYKPVNMLPVLEKVLKLVVKDQLKTFF